MARRSPKIIPYHLIVRIPRRSHRRAGRVPIHHHASSRQSEPFLEFFARLLRCRPPERDLIQYPNLAVALHLRYHRTHGIDVEIQRPDHWPRRINLHPPHVPLAAEGVVHQTALHVQVVAQHFLTVEILVGNCHAADRRNPAPAPKETDSQKARRESLRNPPPGATRTSDRPNRIPSASRRQIRNAASPLDRAAGLRGAATRLPSCTSCSSRAKPRQVGAAQRRSNSSTARQQDSRSRVLHRQHEVRFIQIERNLVIVQRVSTNAVSVESRSIRIGRRSTSSPHVGPGSDNSAGWPPGKAPRSSRNRDRSRRSLLNRAVEIVKLSSDSAAVAVLAIPPGLVDIRQSTSPSSAPVAIWLTPAVVPEGASGPQRTARTSSSAKRSRIRSVILSISSSPDLLPSVSRASASST